METAISVLLNILLWIFKRSNASDAKKKNFIAFYEAHEKLGNDSAKQNDSIKDQLDKLK